MKFYISGLAEVSSAVVDQYHAINRVLSIIEPWEYVNYGDTNHIEIERINMIDVEHNVHYLAPSDKHVILIREWARTLIETDNILIHCHAGVSRSTAAAIIMMYTHNPDLSLIKEALLKVCPKAAPNRLLLTHADSVWGNKKNELYNFGNEINKINNHVDLGLTSLRTGNR